MGRWRNSMMSKLLFALTILFVGIAMAIGFAAYHIAESVVHKNILNAQKDLVNQLGESMEMELDKALTSLMTLYFQEDFRAKLSEPVNDFYGKLQNERDINTMITRAKHNIPIYNCNITVVNRSLNAFGDVGSGVDVLAAKGEAFFQELEPVDYVLWEGGVKGISTATQGKYVINASKAVLDGTGGVLGYIIVEVDEGFFLKLYKDSLALGNDIYLLNEDGRIISSNQREQMTSLIDALYHAEITAPSFYQNQLTEIDGQQYLIFKRQLSPSDWSLVSIVPFSALLSDLQQIRDVIILVVLGAVLLSFLVSFGLVKRFTSPLRALGGKMTLAAKGDFSAVMRYAPKDEIGVLTEGYNSMLRDLKQYMDDLLQRERELKDMEFAALQSQIHPHFLYNTLNAILYLSRNHENERIETVVSALISMLKRSAAHSENEVSIASELEDVANYITILNIRFGGKIKSRFHVEEGLEECVMLKMLVQPIVENAIVHGLSAKEQGLITISVAEIMSGLIRIEITDNGVGMNEQTLHELASSPAGLRFHQIGVANVRERIQTAYGAPYGLHITSLEGIGTTVELLIPRRQKPEALHEPL